MKPFRKNCLNEEFLPETEDNTPKSCRGAKKSAIPMSFGDFCAQKINNNETLTDISFHKDTEKNSNSFVNTNNLNNNNFKIVYFKSSERDLIELINADEIMIENEIMNKDLKNYEVNFTSNDFYFLKINKEFISLNDYNECENVFEVLDN